MQLDNLIAPSPQPNINQALQFLQEMFTNDVWHLVSTQELAEQHLEIKGGHLHAYHPKRLGTLMRGLGWVGPKKFKLASGKSTRGYERHVDYPNQSEWLARK